VACCGAFQSKEDNFKKEMECAMRLTDEKSIEILKKGMFCCEKLPPEAATLPSARRFYLLRAAALQPKDPDPVLQIARSYWDDRNFAEAFKAFEEARALGAKPTTAVIGEITMLRLMERFSEAQPLLAWIREQKNIDAPKVADYLEARLLYDQGKYPEAKVLFLNALERAKSTGDTLGDTAFTMKDTYLYLAQIDLKTGDPQAAYEQFKLYLKKTNDPDFVLFYNYWLEKLGDDQKALYDTMETEWAWPRQ
jgi:tetratricopeptide (TPR) repeat protein